MLFRSDGFWGKARKGWQAVLRWQKVWQIATPGFVSRNLFGGMFNNALAGVDFRSYGVLTKLMLKAERGTLSAEEAKIWQTIIEHVDPGQTLAEAASGTAGAQLRGVAKKKLNIFSTQSAYPRMIRGLNANAEFVLRGTNMYDSLVKGLSVDSAVERMYKFHFNYEDLTKFDQKLRSNIVPFWSWTKNNVPLQLEMLMTNPRPYARVAQIRSNLEQLRERDAFKPGYFMDAWQLPFGKKGNSLHWFPDFPFKDLEMVGAPLETVLGRGNGGDAGNKFMDMFSTPLSATTPAATAWIEWAMKSQVYKGLPLRDDKPIALSQLSPGAIPDWIWQPLRVVGAVQTNKETGKDWISERDLYVLEKQLPLLATYRRFFSSEDKMSQRRYSKLLSFFLGLNVRYNTDADQQAQHFVDAQRKQRQERITRALSGLDN